MVVWLLEAVFYAALAGLVILVNWRRPCTRVAGAALLVFSVVSSLTFFALPFEARIFREMIGATLMAIVAFMLILEGDAKRPYQIVMLLALFDVAFCAALILQGDRIAHLRWLFGLEVNGVFIGMCVCVAAPGVRDAYRNWIAAIDRVRRSDSDAPEMDWALRNLD